MARQFILMGDVIGSSDYEARTLREGLINLVASCNEKLRHTVLSPYTVTLGDEFQGVASSLNSTIEAVFFMEETILLKGLFFKMRYVAVHGEIDTVINPIKAHAMMGSGLTKAREILTNKRRGVPRFRFSLEDDYTTRQLNRLFLVLDGLTTRWELKDGPLILDMINNPNNAKVGIKYNKNRAQIWKRRKTLLVEEYRSLKEAIGELSQQK